MPLDGPTVVQRPPVSHPSVTYVGVVLGNGAR